MNSSLAEDPHGDINVKYFRSTTESAKAVVFLFHGRGGDSTLIHEQLGKDLLRDEIVIVVPEAYSNSWYPYRFNEAVSDNEPWLDSAINWIHREVSEFMKKGMDPARIIFGGFSQGSCLALEYPLRYPQRYGGVFCLSGGVIAPLGVRQPLAPGSLGNTPVFLGCADEDEWIPQDKFDESIEILKNSGAQVESKIYEGLGHNVCTDELDCVREMIDELINTK
jgi:predicted esterase